MEKRDEPLVSIVVRTKDRPVLLFEALSSIAGQIYRNLQVVLVNDGGFPVDSEKIYAHLVDLPFKYIQHDDCLGRSEALNTGIENSEGDFIAFLDDDDLFYSNAIQSLVQASMKNNFAPVYGQVRCARFEEKDGENTITSTTILGESFEYQKLIFENHIPINSMIIPSGIARSVGRFDENFEIYEDWDWIIRMAEIQQPVYILTEVAEYRIFSSSTLTGKGGGQLHRLYREKLLNKHIHKVAAGAFLDYIQKVVDRVVLEKDQVIFEKTQENRRLTDLSDFQESQLQNHIKHIKWQDENIKKQSQEIAEQKEYIEWQNSNIETHTREIEEQKEYIAWQNQNTERQAKELTEQMEHILWLRDVHKNLSQAIQQKEDMNQNLLQVIQHKEDVNQNLLQVIQQKEIVIESLMVENGHHKEEISQLADEKLTLLNITHQNNEVIDQFKHEIEQLRSELESRQKQLDELFSSRTWKLASKFRFMGKILSGFGRVISHFKVSVFL